MSTPVALAFLAASVFFIIGIKLLSSPKTARAGNLVAIGRLTIVTSRVTMVK